MTDWSKVDVTELIGACPHAQASWHGRNLAVEPLVWHECRFQGEGYMCFSHKTCTRPA